MVTTAASDTTRAESSLERFFAIRERGTTVRTEVLGGVVAFDLILGRKLAWPVAMSCIVIEGIVALVLVLAGLREAIMRAIPHEIKLSIGVGIGLFIALVGLRDAGITVNDPATGIGLGELTSGPALVSLGGLLVAVPLTGRRVPGG